MRLRLADDYRPSPNRFGVDGCSRLFWSDMKQREMWTKDLGYYGATGSGLPVGPLPASGVPGLGGLCGGGSVTSELLGAADV